MRTRDVVPAPLSDVPLSDDEVRLLWSFVHGDIMDGDARERLRASWGLCDRHAWGHAVVEIELWEAGAGPAGGHQPFDVCVLHEDLLETAVHRLVRRSPIRALRGSGACPVCRDLGGADTPGAAAVGYAGTDTAALATQVRRLRFTTGRVRAAADVWRSAVCPVCAGVPARDAHDTSERGNSTPSALVCRPHLIRGAAVDAAALADGLGALRAPLHALLDAMTQDGVPADDAARASWITVLGWFHGWDLPIRLTADAVGGGASHRGGD
jgi:hypothetical protein